MRHGGRILLGNNHLYRLSCPYRPEEGQPEEESHELMDYEQAMKEISINELTNGQHPVHILSMLCIEMASHRDSIRK